MEETGYMIDVPARLTWVLSITEQMVIRAFKIQQENPGIISQSNINSVIKVYLEVFDSWARIVQPPGYLLICGLLSSVVKNRKLYTNTELMQSIIKLSAELRKPATSNAAAL